VSFYSTFMFETEEESELFDASCTQNTSLSDERRRRCRRYSQKLSSFDVFFAIHPDFEDNGGTISTFGPKVFFPEIIGKRI